jgi:hypothetical protein
VIGWNHGGVQETLAAMFPQGAVEAGDRAALLERSLEFMRKAPEVLPSDAFGLSESMEKTMTVYQSLRVGEAL